MISSATEIAAITSTSATESAEVAEADAAQHVGDRPSAVGAAERRRRGAHHRQADLQRGQEPLGAIAQRLHRQRALVAAPDVLGEPGLAHRQERDLRAREHPVADDQSENEEEIEHPTDGPHRRTPRSVAELSAVGRRGVVRGRDGASPLARHRRQPRHRP
jgi:hypothetical protein